MDSWNAKQYLMFKNERTQPAIDLCNRLYIDNPKKVLDIGCGPGNSTKILKDKFPNSYILGIDKSEDMINTAKNTYNYIDFKICDIEKDLSILNDDYDIVFSNACIQWLPNHKNVIKNLLNLLKPQGILAIQIPFNYNEPIHKIISEVSGNKKWTSSFPKKRVLYNLTESEYYDILSDMASNFTLWETTYFHKLESHMAILEWYRGTGLRPYLNTLPADSRDDFEKDIYKRIVEEYPKQKDGTILFKFPRLFFIAEK